MNHHQKLSFGYLLTSAQLRGKKGYSMLRQIPNTNTKLVFMSIRDMNQFNLVLTKCSSHIFILLLFVSVLDFLFIFFLQVKLLSIIPLTIRTLHFQLILKIYSWSIFVKIHLVILQLFKIVFHWWFLRFLCSSSGRWWVRF